MPATSNIDSSIPLQAHVPDVFGRLNQVLSAKRQSQAAQQGKIDLDERKAVAEVISSGKGPDGQSILDDNGDPDPDKLGPVIARVAPTTGQAIMQQVQATHQNKIALQQSAGQLANEQRDAVSGIVRSAINDPNAKAEDLSNALEGYAAQNPAAVGAVHYAQKLLAHVDGIADPKQKAAFLNRLAVELQPAGTTSAQQQPSVQGVNTGAQTVFTQTNPQAPGGVQSVGGLNAELRPGEQETEKTDQLGNKYIEIRDQKNGRVIGTKDVPRGTSGAGGPSGPGPSTFGPGQLDALKAQSQKNFENVSSNRTAASLAPQQLDQIDKALAISATVTSGGSFTAKRADFEAAISSIVPGFGSAKDDATKLQLLDKFSERIAADSARVLGANASTDAARDSIHRQNANIGYTPEAIRSVLEYAKSQTIAMQGKGNAQEKWLKQPGHDITSQHDFETAWRQAYDPMIFQMEAAAETPNVVRKLISGMTPAEAKELIRKRDVLRQMGALPPP
jgi:hypothetical protein